jgi:aspartate racemase
MARAGPPFQEDVTVMSPTPSSPRDRDIAAPATGPDQAAPATGQRLVGLLGGMSWESTAEYYRLANELVRERLGGLHSARLVIASVDFAEIERLQVAGDWDRAGLVLAREAARLEAAGAELLVLCTNTMHRVADQVQAAVRIPLLHLADATATAVRAEGLSTVGLLGTAFTMEQDFHRNRLARHGLRVLVPDAADRAEVHRIIYDELCLGVVRPESRQVYREVIGRLVDDGAQGVILGCTEIELLVGAEDSSVPVFPTTRLHVEAAITAALDGRPISPPLDPM